MDIPMQSIQITWKRSHGTDYIHSREHLRRARLHGFFRSFKLQRAAIGEMVDASKAAVRGFHHLVHVNRIGALVSGLGHDRKKSDKIAESLLLKL